MIGLANRSTEANLLSARLGNKALFCNSQRAAITYYKAQITYYGNCGRALNEADSTIATAKINIMSAESQILSQNCQQAGY